MAQYFQIVYKIAEVKLIFLEEQWTPKAPQMLLYIFSASWSVCEIKRLVTVPKVTEEDFTAAHDQFSVYALGRLWRVPIKFKNESISCRNL